MRRLLLSTGCLGLFLSGCAVLPGGGPAPLDTYELTTPTAVETPARRSRTQVLIAEPTALKAFDGENVVIKSSPGSIEFLRGAQWADRLPRVVQARLADAFQRSGRFGGVGRPGEGLAIDYQVITEIRAFEISVEGPARARVELFVRILNDRNGVVRGSRTFTETVPVSGTGNDAFIAALDAAFARAAASIVGWAGSSI